MVFGPAHKSRGASACDVGRYRSRRREGKPVNLRGDSQSQVWNVLRLCPFRYHPSSGTVNGDGSGDGLPVPNGGESDG
jgi:hypothetical protein